MHGQMGDVALPGEGGSSVADVVGTTGAGDRPWSPLAASHSSDPTTSCRAYLLSLSAEALHPWWCQTFRRHDLASGLVTVAKYMHGLAIASAKKP